MSNIASALKAEIARVSRRELRSETDPLKKASAKYRSEIAALKRRIAVLEKQVSSSAKRTHGPAQTPTESAVAKRYSAKGMKAQRRRLGLSAADMGILLGVSAQTVYNWEMGTTRPREGQMAAIVAVRSMGRREANARLQSA